MTFATIILSLRNRYNSNCSRGGLHDPQYASLLFYLALFFISISLPFRGKCSDVPSTIIQDEEATPSSRRKCLVCLSAVTLISTTGPTMFTPNGLAADMVNKPGIQKAVCRNCNGSGAVICKGLAALVHFVCCLLMLNDFISSKLLVLPIGHLPSIGNGNYRTNNFVHWNS